MSSITCPKCGEAIKPLPHEILRFMDLTLDVNRQVLSIRDSHLALSPSQTRVLAELMRHPEMMCSQDNLMTVNDQWDVGPGGLRVFIYNLRKILAAHDSSVAIEARRGVGYAIIAKACQAYPFYRSHSGAASSHFVQPC